MQKHTPRPHRFCVHRSHEPRWKDNRVWVQGHVYQVGFLRSVVLAEGMTEREVGNGATPEDTQNRQAAGCAGSSTVNLNLNALRCAVFVIAGCACPHDLLSVST